MQAEMASASRCQRTAAAGATSQRLVSYTRPPSGLAQLVGAGGWGSLSSATIAAKVLWHLEGGGWAAGSSS
jgi:hypothetical protein